MKFQSLILFAVSLILISCENRKSDLAEDDLNSVKKEFLNKIFLAEVEEGPFIMHYSMKTIFSQKTLLVFLVKSMFMIVCRMAGNVMRERHMSK